MPQCNFVLRQEERIQADVIGTYLMALDPLHHSPTLPQIVRYALRTTAAVIRRRANVARKEQRDQDARAAAESRVDDSADTASVPRTIAGDAAAGMPDEPGPV